MRWPARWSVSWPGPLPSTSSTTGRLVYPHGEEANYRPQFFAPYAAYDAPIFAIPGNHRRRGLRLSGTVLEPVRQDVRLGVWDRSTMPPSASGGRQPPATRVLGRWSTTGSGLIGLYTNVHEDGELGEDQLEMMTGELAAVPRDALAILAVHRPPFSIDSVHGSTWALRRRLRCLL